MYEWATFIATATAASSTALESIGVALIGGGDGTISNVEFRLLIAGVVATGISAFLSGYIKAYNPSEMANQHRESVQGYQQIVTQVENELTKDANERTDGVVFLDKISKQMTQLAQGSPSIGEFVWNSLIARFKDHGAFSPQSEIAIMNRGAESNSIGDIPAGTGAAAPHVSKETYNYPTLKININHRKPGTGTSPKLLINSQPPATPAPSNEFIEYFESGMPSQLKNTDHTLTDLNRFC